MKTLVSFLCIALFSFINAGVIAILISLASILRMAPRSDNECLFAGALFVIVQFCSLSLALGVRPTIKLLLGTLSGQGVLYYLVQVYGPTA